MSKLNIQRSGDFKPPIMVIHGPPGIGKTTFAANAPNPLFVPVEDGLGILQVDYVPVIQSWHDLMDVLGSVYSEEHQYKTIAIDSLSALEPLLWQQVAIDNGVNGIESIPYGKGYVLALDYWSQFLQGIVAIRDAKGITPILIAHSEVVRYEAPDSDPYDRYQIKLHKRAFQLLYERADIIGFATNKTLVVRSGDSPSPSEQKKGVKGKYRGISTGERLLHLVEKPAFIAKNRYSLPETINLGWQAFSEVLFTNRNNTND